MMHPFPGPRSLKLLGILMIGIACALGAEATEERRYPPTPFVVDVTRPPYSAKGDGVTDDTAALQSALNDHVGRHRLLFFPKGIYLVSRSLTWPKQWNGRENWGHTKLQGASANSTVIRLRDGVFTDPAKPEAIMVCGGFGSADWFHNYVEDLTFDVGDTNAGATALRFYSNNSGAVRNCRFVARPGSGVVGLDLAHQDMNGPLLVRDCEVIGFQRGVVTGHSVNSQTFENLSLRGQSDTGFDNQGQTVSLRGLRSENAVPALRTYGFVALIEARIQGSAGASNLPAVVNYNGGRLWVRDLGTSGYHRAIADVQSPDVGAAMRVSGPDRPGTEGPNVAEYSSQSPTRAFPSGTTMMRLLIRETPVATWDPPESWADVDAFGADPTGMKDSSGAIQKAIDSGATTVFLPGSYRLQEPVLVRGRVARLLGLGGMISYGKESGPDFRIVDGTAPTVIFEHFGAMHGGVEVDTARTVVFRSVSDCDLTTTPRARGGVWFFEDFVTHNLRLNGQRVWARQLNVENEGIHIENSGGRLWILGLKTERGGTLVETVGGGATEILGGFSYTTTAGGLGPMFINRNSAVFTVFAEVCYSGDPFKTLILETRGDETRRVLRGEGHTAPYVGVPDP